MMIDDADSSADPLDDVEAMPSTLIKSHYQKQGPQAVARLYDAVYYMQNRETGGDEEPGPRDLFGATGDMTSKQARQLLRARQDRSVLYHREIMSPSPAHGLQTQRELEAWTREVVGTLSNYLGLDLAWCAAVHRNTAHPHAHVLISGAGIRRSDGKQIAVRLKRQHLDLMRQAGIAAGVRLSLPREAARATDRQRDMAALVERARSRQQETSPVIAQPVSVQEEPRESFIGRLFSRGR